MYECVSFSAKNQSACTSTEIQTLQCVPGMKLIGVYLPTVPVFAAVPIIYLFPINVPGRHCIDLSIAS